MVGGEEWEAEPHYEGRDDRFEWDEHNLESAQRHGVTWPEIEDALDYEPQVDRFGRDERHDEVIYRALATVPGSGRYVSMLYVLRRGGRRTHQSVPRNGNETERASPLPPPQRDTLEVVTIMAARTAESTKSSVASESLRAFDGLEEAARYAETHDVGEPGEPAELPPPAGATMMISLPAGLLKRLRREALRRHLDIAGAAQAVLDEALPDHAS